MEHPIFNEKARVVDREGSEIGILLAVDDASAGSIIVVGTPDGREIGIPFEQVDMTASTDVEIVVDLPTGSLTIDAEEQPSARHGMLSLAEEEMVTSTRWTEKGRVVIRKRVETVPQEKTIELAQEGVEVERIPINEIVAEMPQVRTERDTTIIPVVEEVLVVEKRYRLVEEVRVTSTRSTEQHTVREDLRREVVDIEEIPTREGDIEP